MQIFLLLRKEIQQDQQLDRPCGERTDGRAPDAHAGEAEVSEDQQPVDPAVDEKGAQRKPEGDLHDLRAPQHRQKHRRHTEQRVGKADDPQIIHALGQDGRVIGEQGDHLHGKQGNDREENGHEEERRAHGDPGDPLDRLRPSGAPVLRGKDDHSVSDADQDVLVDELDLVYCRGAGQGSLGESSQHQVVRQVDAQRDDVLENDGKAQRKEGSIEFFLTDHPHRLPSDSPVSSRTY